MGGLLLRDFSFFLGQTLFHSTPLWVISVTFILVVGYACYLGIEAIARSSEVLSVFHFCLFLFLITLGFLSPHFSFHHLFPVFQTPWHKILSSLFPRSITFPFGELMVLATLIPLVKEKDSLRKNGWFPILLSGLLLILSAEMVIGILQAELPKMYYFPFIKAVEALTFLEFFQRMEVVAVLLSITGGFIKLSLFFYGGWYLYTELFQKEENGKQVLVTCSLIFLLSFTFSHNIVIHFLIGFQVIPWIHVFFQFIVPLLLFTILRFRNPSSVST